MIDPRVASGLRDIPPSAMIPRERMLAAFRATFASFGFLPIETPHIERMDVLTGKGAGSDEVLRQIFDVTNKGGTPGELALRFDLTVPLARFVAKHVDELGTPFKRYAIGSVFRGERPGKGRFREFVQCDFDIVGSLGVIADAEIINVIHDALNAAGVPEFSISLNNRRVLYEILFSFNLQDRMGYVTRTLDKLSKIGRAKVEAELCDPLQGLPDGVATGLLDIIEKGRGGTEVLDWAETELLPVHPRLSEGLTNLRQILSLLDAAGVPKHRVRIDFGLARGLDYYTGVIFETTVNGWERMGSISSGGRYDNLTSLFSNKLLPGVGASIGLDRLQALLEEAKLLGAAGSPAPVLVANFPGGDPATAVKLAARLRKANIGAEVYPDAIQVGKQMGYGSTRGHRLAVIVGPDEQGRAVFNLRDLATRQEQKAIPWADLESEVTKALRSMSSDGAGS